MPNKPVITIVDDDESVREATMSLMRAFGFARDQSAAVCRRRFAPWTSRNFLGIDIGSQAWYLVYHRPVGASSIG